MPRQAATTTGKRGQREREKMWRLFKFLVWLAVLAALVLVAYAYVGPVLFPDHFVPAVSDRSAPILLELD
jgi:hypothetical protein